MTGSQSMTLIDYRSRFESEIIIPGARSGVLGKTELVPVSRGKLHRTRFGKMLGSILESEEILVIDYYGHLKKSEGFLEKQRVTELDLPGRQVKMIESTVVHFAAIKIEAVAALAEDLSLVAQFPEFKKRILTLRGFWKEEKVHG